jgi:transketolase
MMTVTTKDAEIAALKQHLRDTSRAVRINALKMVHQSRLGHPGGDLSCTDILVTLYEAILKIDPKNPRWPERDRFILSKGHCSAALYAALAAAEILDEADLKTFMAPLSKLNGHPDRNKVAGVEANTGPLGHGLPIAVGCALAAKMRGSTWRTFVMTGDGELQEGSNWEAAMCAAQYKLDNLVLIVDRNRIQQGDFTENIVNIDPLGDKWRAFGWSVAEVQGHNHEELWRILGSVPAESGKPTCVIAHTIKGCGVSFMENKPEWHHGIPTDAQLAAAIDELTRDGQ